MRAEGARDDTERYATEFVLKLLKKRLFSSPQAFAATLDKHLQSLAQARRSAAGRRHTVSPGILRRQVEGIDEDAADDDQLDVAIDEAVETAALLFRPLSAEEQDLLHQLSTYSKAASARADSKAQCLMRWLESELRPIGKWSDRRVIIFTEYRATQKWLQGLLAHQGFGGGERLLTMFGGMPSDDKERIEAAFQASPSISPVRILLATDSASEGIDPQNHCSRLIHYEIPARCSLVMRALGASSAFSFRLRIAQSIWMSEPLT